MQSIKYFEIFSREETEGHFFGIDRTVTGALLKQLQQFVDQMCSFQMSRRNFKAPQILPRKKVEELLLMNEYIGYDRFHLTHEVLTAEQLRSFFKCFRSVPEEVNDIWYESGSITFDLDVLEGFEEDSDSEFSESESEATDNSLDSFLDFGSDFDTDTTIYTTSSNSDSDSASDRDSGYSTIDE